MYMVRYYENKVNCMMDVESDGFKSRGRKEQGRGKATYWDWTGWLYALKLHSRCLLLCFAFWLWFGAEVI